MSDDDTGKIMWSILATLAFMLLVLWLWHHTYDECMEEKHDDIICTTYVNSFFN